MGWSEICQVIAREKDIRNKPAWWLSYWEGFFVPRWHSAGFHKSKGKTQDKILLEIQKPRKTHFYSAQSCRTLPSNKNHPVTVQVVSFFIITTLCNCPSTIEILLFSLKFRKGIVAWQALRVSLIVRILSPVFARAPPTEASFESFPNTLQKMHAQTATGTNLCLNSLHSAHSFFFS